MSRKKRLFLFAGYDQDGIIDDALIYYLRQLSMYGDIILCMDNKFNKRQIKKLTMHPLSVFITRHKEYDFGSYKRAFQYAKKNNLLQNYEFVYLVNDSVFGPMINLSKIIKQMEKIPSDAVGMVESAHTTYNFMESWFIRLNKKIFLSPWFDEFISSVTKEADKIIVTIKYEHGLTNLITKHKCSWSCVYTVHGRDTYNRPKQLFKTGCPFIKKSSFTRHNGAIGRQVKYVLKHSDKKAVSAVMKTANRVYGEKNMKRLLTSNPLKILYRNVTYIIKKIRNGEI